MAGGPWLNFGVRDWSATLIVATLPVLAGAAVWQSFRDAGLPAEPVPLRERAVDALLGDGALLVVYFLLTRLIPVLAPEPSYYPERFFESRAELGAEALGIGLAGTLVALLLPARLRAAEARDPVRAVVSFPAAILVPRAFHWAVMKASFTHAGSPPASGRALLLSLAFGLGAAARAAFSATPAPSSEDAPTTRLDRLYAVAVGLAVLVASVVTGFGEGVLLGLNGVLALLAGALLVQWRARRSESDAAELARAALLSLPLVAFALPLGLVAHLGRLGADAGAGPLQVPIPLAAAGTVWLAGVAALAGWRLRLPPP